MISIPIYFRYVTQHVVWFQIGKLPMHISQLEGCPKVQLESSITHSKQCLSDGNNFRWIFFRPRLGALITILQAHTVWWMTPFLIWEEDSTHDGASSRVIEGGRQLFPSETIIRRKASRFLHLQSRLLKAQAVWGIVTSVDASHISFILIEASRSIRFLNIFRRTDP